MPTLFEDAHASIEVKKSKFICYLHATKDEDDAREFIKLVKKEHPNASHHCQAMVIDQIARSNDDGEPSGTAGHPMLDVLLKKNLNKVTAVVVRYFGGTLLGKGGLVKAYTNAVLAALDEATLMEVRPLYEYLLEYDYGDSGKIDSYLKKMNIEKEECDYDEKVHALILSPFDCSNDIRELSSGKALLTKMGTVEKEYPLED